MLRLGVLVAAIWYVLISCETVIVSTSVLRGMESHAVEPETYSSSLIESYIGSSTINKSRLVVDVLDNITTPQGGVIFLESKEKYSSIGCSTVVSFNTDLYSATYLHFMFAQFQSDLAYEITLMADLELITPVVDCTFTGLVDRDDAAAKVYYLVRRASNPSHLLVLSTTMSVQNYFVDQQHQIGPALFATIAVLDDMSVGELDYLFAIAPNYPYAADPKFIVCEFIEITAAGFWRIREIPIHPLVDPVRDIRTVFGSGFYIDGPDAQSNIKNWYWVLQKTPTAELSKWEWHGLTRLQDSWGWTHYIHAVFAFYIAFHLGVLIFIMYRGLKQKRLWLGDAFAAISNALLYRGILVLVSNHLNGYYTWSEYSVALGYELADISVAPIYYRAELLQADLLTLYLNVASVMSYASGERIHPLLAVASFISGFHYRVVQADSSAIRIPIISFANEEYASAEAEVGASLKSLSPFVLHTIHPLSMNGSRLVALTAAIMSIFSALIWVVLYIILKKMHRRLMARFSKPGTNYRSSRGQIMERTQFESATGAALRRRFGVILGYDNYVEIDGRHYATPDAVYGNGFVVANKKFVVATGDLLSILLMKVTRVRFRNIFVYELTGGDTVNQTARLVYPQTIQWGDLFQLDVSKLA